jgi:hypothetical protein
MGRAKAPNENEMMDKASRVTNFVVGARLLRRLLFAGIVLASFLVITSYRAAPPKQPKGASTSPDQAGRQPVHVVIKSRSEIKQVFTYFPYPAVPTELQGYAGSKVNGIGLYRLKVDPQGVVTQVTVLKGFTVAASYDERFSDIKGNPVPALDKITLQALTRWRAKPGPMRVVDLYWSFGTQPWVNYGK